MATTSRHKNGNWTLPAEGLSLDHAQLAVLMDIRDELQANNAKLESLLTLARCFRVARGFDAMHELSKDARRRNKMVRERAAKQGAKTRAKRKRAGA